MTHCVLGDHARFDELEEVVRPACLRADARAAIAAEWLTTDHRSGDIAVHVEVPHRCPPGDMVDGGRTAREETAGERERGGVDGVAGSFHVAYALDGQQGTEDLLAQDARLSGQIGGYPRQAEPALGRRVWPRRRHGPLARSG